ncbi:adhesin biosynthesis transcription regulatory family protein [Escherichia coli]
MKDLWGFILIQKQSECDISFFLCEEQMGKLIPGKVNDVHFGLLIDISPIYSDKVIQALRDFLVLGFTRREACERHGVSPGYFSIALGRIQRVSKSVLQLMPYYV